MAFKQVDLSLAPRIGQQQARAEFDQGTALFVDVRTPTEYELCHIQGAVSIPLGEISQWSGELPRDRTLITYCA